MQLGLHKPLGLPTPLGQTVQRFGQPPLGQFSTGKSLQRRSTPTLGQKLQSTFKARPEQINFAVSEAAVPTSSAQFVGDSAKTTKPIDRPETRQSTADSQQVAAPIDRPESSLEKLAPLGERSPLADRQPLTQSANFLSLKSEESFDQTTSSATNSGQLRGTTPTPNRICRQVQSQIQAQLEQRSPATSIQSQPQAERFEQIEATSTASRTNVESPTEEIQLNPGRLQRSPTLQADVSSQISPTLSDRSEQLASDRSTSIEANIPIISASIQQQVEPQQLTIEQVQLRQDEAIANSTSTTEKAAIPTSDLPDSTQKRVSNLEVPIVQRQRDSVLPIEASTQHPNELESERSTEPAINPLPAESSTPAPSASPQSLLRRREVSIDQNRQHPQVEPEVTSSPIKNQLSDRLPSHANQPAPNAAIEPPQTTIEPAFQSDLVEPDRSPDQLSTNRPFEPPRAANLDVAANQIQAVTQPQIEQKRSNLEPKEKPSFTQPKNQAKQASTPNLEIAEAAISTPQLPTSATELSTPVESKSDAHQPLIEQADESIDRPIVSPSIEATKQSLIQEETLPIQNKITPEALPPSPESTAADIQKKEDIRKAEAIEPTANFEMVIESSLQEVQTTLEVQDTVQARQVPEAKLTSSFSEVETSFDRLLEENEAVSSVETTTDQSTFAPSEPQQIQPKIEKIESSTNSIEPPQQPSTRSISTPTAIESIAATTQTNPTEIPCSRQPLGVTKPIAQPPDLLMPKRDSSIQTDRQSALPAIDFPNTWSSIDELLEQPNPASEKWQQQFNLEPMTEELVSPIANRSTANATGDSPSPHLNSEQEYTLTSPIATSTQQKESIDEQQLELMAQVIYGLIRDRLAVEKERYFQTASNHPPWTDVISPEFFKSVKPTAKPDSPNAQQQPASIWYPPQRQLEELSRSVYQLIQQRLEQDRERSRWKYR